MQCVYRFLFFLFVSPPPPLPPVVVVDTTNNDYNITAAFCSRIIKKKNTTSVYDDAVLWASVMLTRIKILIFFFYFVFPRPHKSYKYCRPLHTKVTPCFTKEKKNRRILSTNDKSLRFLAFPRPPPRPPPSLHRPPTPLTSYKLYRVECARCFFSSSFLCVSHSEISQRLFVY